MQKIDDEKFALPDWYGRKTAKEWQNNRDQHRRRVCYEVSRYLAKALTKVFEKNDNYDICVLWDVELTHYFVGLSCNEYTITLDVDEFNNIKDLTRIKTGLTTKGIVILEDDNKKFTNAYEDFNKDRNKHAIKEITEKIKANNSLASQDNKIEEIEEDDDVIFLRNAVEILIKEYDIDSQGLFEYMKEIIDVKLGPDARGKLWKKLEGKSNEETRYTRCLVFDVDAGKYIIDVDKKIVRPFSEDELTKDDAEFIVYKNFSRDWGEYYNGL